LVSRGERPVANVRGDNRETPSHHTTQEEGGKKDTGAKEARIGSEPGTRSPGGKVLYGVGEIREERTFSFARGWKVEPKRKKGANAKREKQKNNQKGKRVKREKTKLPSEGGQRGGSHFNSKTKPQTLSFAKGGKQKRVKNEESKGLTVFISQCRQEGDLEHFGGG